MDPPDDKSSETSEVELVERREENVNFSVPKRAMLDKPGPLSEGRLDMQPAVFDAWLKLQRTSNPSSFLFQKPLDNILKPSWMKTEHLFKPPSIGMIPAVVTPHDTSSAPCSSGTLSKMASNRLRHTQLVKTDDHVKWEAMKKLKTLLLADPAMSKLGRSLVSGVQLLTSEAEWATSLSDAFAGKAVATLAKRASSLWKVQHLDGRSWSGPSCECQRERGLQVPPTS